MDDAQLTELRAWAKQLAEHASGELKAAARAILMLADEVEALRGEPAAAPAAGPVAEAPADEGGGEGEGGEPFAPQPLRWGDEHASGLAARLKRTFGFD